MPELKQSEKFALVRKSALDALTIPEVAVQVGSSTYAWLTDHGAVKVAITAVKDAGYDPAVEAEAYAVERANAEAKALATKAEAERKRAAKGK